MTEYKILNVELSNSQFKELKPGIKFNTEIPLKLSSNVFGNSNDDNNIPHKFLLTNTQVSRLCKAFANNSSANIKLSETHFHKIRQSGGFLGILIDIGILIGILITKNVLKPLAKSDTIKSNSSNISDRCSYS